MGKKSRRKKTGGGGGAASSETAEALRNAIQLEIQREQNESIQQSKRMMEKLGSHPLPVQISTIRRVLQDAGTDVDGNDADLMGDGDQSLIRTEEAREAARTLFSIGGDINSHFEQDSVSAFAKLCVLGEARGVERILFDITASHDGPSSDNARLVQILETRETSMRLSPLLLTVAAGKNVVPESGQPLGHRNVVRILFKYGARPHAKDVVGKTVCHYGAGMMATRMTLDATDMCIRAAKSAHLYGKEVELFGLNNTAMNGCRGVVGGYLTENDRRAVYLFSKSKEVAINPINLRRVETVDGSDQKLMMLADIPDRMGAVCLLEAIMENRADVAEFLVTKHHASIDAEDMDGMTPRKLSTSGTGPFASQAACAIVQKEARNQSKKARKEDRLHCSFCEIRADEYTKLQQCSMCQSVQYCNSQCQMSHWEETHKRDCKLLRGIKLDPPSNDGPFGSMQSVLSRSTGRFNSEGSYRKPDEVDFDERFNIKVQASADTTPIMIYDKSRQCQFMMSPGQPGFIEILQAARSQTAFEGRKCFIKASFDEEGRCTVYPGTANVKHAW